MIEFRASSWDCDWLNWYNTVFMPQVMFGYATVLKATVERLDMQKSKESATCDVFLRLKTAK